MNPLSSNALPTYQISNWNGSQIIYLKADHMWHSNVIIILIDVKIMLPLKK